MITIAFRREVRYHGGSGHPELVVKLHRTGRLPLALVAELDSGMENTLFSGDALEILGFDPPPNAAADHPDVRKFSGMSGGAPILGWPFPVSLEVGGDLYEMEVYGSLVPLPRNLIGRDFFSRSLVAFHDERTTVYLDSNRDADPQRISST